jgi:hypothetical protein
MSGADIRRGREFRAERAQLISSGRQRCCVCLEIKPLVEGFYRNSRCASGHSVYCKTCCSSWQKLHQHRIHLRHVYGIELEEFEAMFEAQGGVCAICGEPPVVGRRLSVDHEHDSDQVRGLLCQKCNAAIGMLGDDPEVIERAAQYIRKARERVS